MAGLLAGALATGGCAAVFDIQDRPYDPSNDAAIADGAEAQAAGNEAAISDDAEAQAVGADQEATAVADAVSPSEENTTLESGAISANDASPTFEGDAEDALASSEDAPALDSPVDVQTPGEGSTSKDTGPPESGAMDSTAPCNPLLLAPQMAAASSVYPLGNASEGAPALAVDGVLSTCWESQWMVDPQWLDVDFGMTVYVSEVDILWQACAADYTLELSKDQVNWTTIATVTNNLAVNNNAPTNWNNAAVHKRLAGSGRYLRVNGTVRCPVDQPYGYAIWEARVYGSPTCQP
jgi:hypothetical protein